MLISAIERQIFVVIELLVVVVVLRYIGATVHPALAGVLDLLGMARDLYQIVSLALSVST